MLLSAGFDTIVLRSPLDWAGSRIVGGKLIRINGPKGSYVTDRKTHRLRVHWNHKSGIIEISFSLPKILRGENIRLAEKPNEISAALDVVNDSLAMNLTFADVVRLDIA